MNIGIFTDTYYPEINGVANSAYQLKKELEARGNKVYVFTVSNPEVKKKESGVFRMKSLPFVLLKDRRMSYEFANRWIEKIKDLHLDIIHTQTEFAIGHVGRRAAKELNIPMVHTYHTIYEDYTHYLKIPGNQKLKGVVKAFSRYCCNKADTVIVPTEKIKKLLNGYAVRRKIMVQPTGIDMMKFAKTESKQVEQLKEKFHLTGDNHILISIGRLSQEKNIGELIHFTKRLVQMDSMVRLLIVGSGPEEEKLSSLVREYKMEKNVIFAGAADWKDIQNYYALGDIFVCASRSETQGLTYLEALASGKPLLVRSDECLEGILEDGKDGYSYSSEDEFLDGYQKLFEQNMYLSMEKTAKEYASKISANKFGMEIERIYRKTICTVLQQKEGQEIYGQIHSIAG